MGKKEARALSKNSLLIAFFISILANLFLLLNKYLPSLRIFKKENQSSATISRVIDGDTAVSQEGDYFRLAGIDAPEYPKGCLSLKAKERLEELVLGKKTKIEVLKKDNFGRSLVFLFLDDVLINRVLIEEGLARSTDNKLNYSPVLIKAEQEAKKIQKGIWSSLCSNQGECVIKGNVRKDNKTKVYHLSDCYNYEKVVIDEGQGDRWFCNEEEAIEAGFTKSKDCP